MTGLEVRQRLANDVEQARQSGARLSIACQTAGIDVRSLQRWKRNEVGSDRRPLAVRPAPSHALTDAERGEVLQVADSAPFADMPPARIVPMLADAGRSPANPASRGSCGHTGTRAERSSRPCSRTTQGAPAHHPRCHRTGPGVVLGHDLLPADVAGRWFHLFLIMDLYSRKIIGWEVHESDSADHATRLVQRTALTERIAIQAPDQRPVLHGDNGASFKATTVLAMLHWLGIKPYSREWASRFAGWYNQQHRHSGIRYVTPEQRHAGLDKDLLAARHQVYQHARAKHPARWSRSTRNWTPIVAVALNPEKGVAVATAAAASIKSKAA